MGLSDSDYAAYQFLGLACVDELKNWKASGLTLAKYYKSKGRDASRVNNYRDQRPMVNNINKNRRHLAQNVTTIEKYILYFMKG